jgi:phosphoribosylformimino-5-aminoimidazole carboxamide ribotide isomerase
MSPRAPVSSFTIIPVLDLKHGKVVRARAGDRANYQPIVTPLSRTSEAIDVLRGLHGLAAFPIIYIADLDAITGEGSHFDVLRMLATAAPEVEFWIDGGFRTGDDTRAAMPAGMTPVFGSESLADAAALGSARETFGAGKIVLSLDYRGARFMGLGEIEQRPELWPDRIILMTLDRVGTGTGPDLDALAALVQRARGRAVFAAGGVRNEDDLARLRAIGVSGALVATALHDGRLSAAAVARFQH